MSAPYVPYDNLFLAYVIRGIQNVRLCAQNKPLHYGAWELLYYIIPKIVNALLYSIWSYHLQQTDVFNDVYEGAYAPTNTFSSIHETPNIFHVWIHIL